MALKTTMIQQFARENSEEHKTNFYEMIYEENPTPVLRRGKKFSLAVTFSREYNDDNDDIKLVFKYGKKPHITQGTIGIAPIISTSVRPLENNPEEWGANLLAVNEDSSLAIEVFTPTTIPVGLWKLSVVTNIKNSSNPPLESESKDLYLLFNPWNSHDQVFMPAENLLDEYILKDIGKIWRGPLGASKGIAWVFGQFDACVLPAIMLMFEQSGLNESLCGNPIKLTRMISRMVNYFIDDELGILIGGWDNHYDDGTEPTSWTGSVPILKEFLDKKTAVRYGQCWVFAGVVTTICRAIGIPSRVVSNLVSAHDSNATLSVDTFFDENDKEIRPYDTKDSIWTFHVWNEVYMARPDLYPGYGGWQAIDATPQQTSDGLYQCGPASVKAIRQGNIGFNYDVGYMISTVNADVMHWKMNTNNPLKITKIYSHKYHIGRHILTKKPGVYDFNGDKDRLDITNYYKAAEGTEAERLLLLNAVKNASAMARAAYELPNQSENDGVQFNLRDIVSIDFGDDFEIIVDIKNNSDQTRTIKCTLSADTVYYHGIKYKSIIRKQTNVSMEPYSEQTVKHLVYADQYANELVEHAIIKIHFIATVMESSRTCSDQDDIQVILPNITIEVPDEILHMHLTKITLEFSNPLNRTLTNCHFNVSGPKQLENQLIRCEDLPPFETLKVDVMIVPRWKGLQKIVATFTSREFMAITGSAKTNVC